jgi:glycosyltransferase 2 family protein
VGSRWVRVGQWVVGLAIVAFACRSLLRNWDQLRAQPLDWRPSPGWLVLAAALVWVMYALLIAAWRVMLQAWGQRLDPWTSARIWTVSSLGKYLPGKVWAVAGMAVMAQQAGVAPGAAMGSAVILQALAIGTGAAVAGVCGVGALRQAHPEIVAVLLLLVGASAAGIGLLFWPPLVRRLLRIAVPDAATADTGPAGPAIAFGVMANVAAWVGYGVAFWCLTRGLLPDTRLTLTQAVAVFTASYLAGFLALFAPGGLGVRESVFILMLQGPVGPAAAAALALASRVLLTITEFGAAVPFLAFPRGRPRVAH